MLLHKSLEFDSRVRREAATLAEAGHSVSVLELSALAPGEEMLDGVHRQSVLPPQWLERALPFHLYRIAFLFSFVLGVTRLRPDVIHAHDAAMLLPALIGARLTGARLVYDSHELATGVPYRGRMWTWFVDLVERVGITRCAAVITVSDGIASRLRDRYHLSVTPTLVRNVSALQVSSAGGLRRRIGLASHDPLVLHQGAPAPDRGCEVLVQAVSQLDGIHLVFLGDPEPGYGERLRAAIDEHGLSDRVSMLPSVPLEELLAFTAEADVGVTLLQDTCENHRLALPNKLFEYIAAGIPVVASALPETGRLIARYGIGWTATGDDPDSVAEALRQALTHRGEPGLAERLQRAASELRWSQEREHLLAVYERQRDEGGLAK